MTNNIKSVSKLLSLALRHKPEVLSLSLDQNGWAKTEDVLKGLESKGRKVDFTLLQKVFL